MHSVIIDCHSHTRHSPDGSETVLDMCTRAVELGIEIFAITDHCEAHEFGGDDISSAIKNCIEDIDEVSPKFSGRMEILKGVELGQPTQNTAFSEKLISEMDLDFVLCALHEMRGYDDFYFLNYYEQDIHELLTRYFDELQEICEWGKCDAIAHFTYPIRYIHGRTDIRVNLENYYEKIKSIYKIMIEKGIALEINTSGLRGDLGDTLPDYQCIKLYHDIGGQLISVGSDAHKAVDVGQGINDAIAIAKDIGFKKITYFKSRNANFISI